MSARSTVGCYGGDRMEMKPEQLFAFLESAYRNEVVDKLLPLVGLSLDVLKAKTGMGMDELLDKLDGAQPESIEKFDKFLGLATPLIVIARHDLLMKVLARLLEIGLVQKITVWGVQWYLGRALAKSMGTLPPLSERLKGMPARIMAKSVGS